MPQDRDTRPFRERLYPATGPFSDSGAEDQAAAVARSTVAIIDHLSHLARHGTLAFLVIGVTAAPSCVLWDLLARRLGVFNALILAITGTLAVQLGYYQAGLYLAAGVMLIGIALLVVARWVEGVASVDLSAQRL